MENFNLSEYMSGGIENILKNILKASIKNPRESAFIMKFMAAAKKAKAKRENYEKLGDHIPPFIMASIETNCNLYCKGCYARANKSCGENLKDGELSVDRWREIFHEAKELGVSFILLLGGEPLLRKEVINEARKYKEIIFPIFTNGTMVDEEYISLFNENRNLIPMISIEGNRKETDARRGIGTYNRLMKAMEALKAKNIIFGGSITVTTENLETVTSKEYLHDLYAKGVRALIFSEYVPVNKNTEDMALGDEERIVLDEKLKAFRKEVNDMVVLSFPGDEKYTGGCLSAGRGFFHISAKGNVEPCPFSPYSDVNLKDNTLKEALKSPLFNKLKCSNILSFEHKGGCVLFSKEEDIKRLLDN